MMHDSSVIYPNYLKLYRENYATGKLEFADIRTSISPLYHVEFSSNF